MNHLRCLGWMNMPNLATETVKKLQSKLVCVVAFGAERRLAPEEKCDDCFCPRGQMLPLAVIWKGWSCDGIRACCQFSGLSNNHGLSHESWGATVTRGALKLGSYSYWVVYSVGLSLRFVRPLTTIPATTLQCVQCRWPILRQQTLSNGELNRVEVPLTKSWF